MVDIVPDIMPLADLSHLTRRIETDRFGPFVFQVGIEPNQVELLLQRIEDAHERFVASPLAQVANQLPPLLPFVLLPLFTYVRAIEVFCMADYVQYAMNNLRMLRI